MATVRHSWTKVNVHLNRTLWWLLKTLSVVSSTDLIEAETSEMLADQWNLDFDFSFSTFFYSLKKSILILYIFTLTIYGSLFLKMYF